MTKQDIFKIICEELKSLELSNLNYENINIFKESILKDGEIISEEELRYIDYANLLLAINSKKSLIHTVNIISKLKNYDMNEYKIALEKCLKTIENTQYFKELEKSLLLLSLAEAINNTKN
ncbi:hypothetical protein AVANS_0537 [Campylobacter sp. RM5004]|uniref:hypothetical protein n=1 Tax=Campylobacter sp. RM5004 TaxID=1660078 RepID=UPI001EFB3599|nr:hypothetical protein [Campylobacter sp. RM5004]ULO01172.1 hypothetical protein AVANS_0537 [Campylobacter sp. RM5004]